MNHSCILQIQYNIHLECHPSPNSLFCSVWSYNWLPPSKPQQSTGLSRCSNPLLTRSLFPKPSATAGLSPLYVPQNHLSIASGTVYHKRKSTSQNSSYRIVHHIPHITKSDPRKILYAFDMILFARMLICFSISFFSSPFW